MFVLNWGEWYHLLSGVKFLLKESLKVFVFECSQSFSVIWSTHPFSTNELCSLWDWLESIINIITEKDAQSHLSPTRKPLIIIFSVLIHVFPDGNWGFQTAPDLMLRRLQAPPRSSGSSFTFKFTLQNLNLKLKLVRSTVQKGQTRSFSNKCW